ncbi:hypothetical protein N7494_011321 [Penicillium frequentans]|uniref:BZIP domain-containing protein n=1 Tax=Penicillium frequentans TaxID=3151616 RepID=A0AAD6CK11_9EURO|nr:hypothetical protein N7494_011321 [Penicillium glabrum]
MAGPSSDSANNVVSDKFVTPEHFQVSSTRPLDPKERKRNQNRIAQRTYSEKTPTTRLARGRLSNGVTKETIKSNAFEL